MFDKARFLTAGLAVLLLGALTPLLVQSANNPENVALDAMILTSSTDECDCGVWGDVTGEGNIDPLDMMYVVNYVFRELDALVQPASCPYNVGDVDCDEAVTPVDVVMITNIVFRSNGLGSCGNPCWNTSGTVDGWTGCTYSGLGKTTEPATYQECIQYEYDGLDVLSLLHLNALLNCCPTRVEVEVERGIGNIVINELSDGFCYCECLRDIDMEIVGLPPGAYTIIINEASFLPGEEPVKILEFTADLRAATVGEYCEERQ